MRSELDRRPNSLNQPQRPPIENCKKPTSSNLTGGTRQPSVGRKPSSGKTALPEFATRRTPGVPTSYAPTSTSAGAAARSTSVPRPTSRNSSMQLPAGSSGTGASHAAVPAAAAAPVNTLLASPRGVVASRPAVPACSILDFLRTPSVLPGGASSAIASLAQRMNSSSGWDYSTLAGGASSPSLRLKRQAGCGTDTPTSPGGPNTSVALSAAQQQYLNSYYPVDQTPRAVYLSGPVTGIHGGSGGLGLPSAPVLPTTPGAASTSAANRQKSMERSVARTSSFSSVQVGGVYGVAGGSVGEMASSNASTPSALPLPRPPSPYYGDPQQQQQRPAAVTPNCAAAPAQSTYAASEGYVSGYERAYERANYISSASGIPHQTQVRSSSLSFAASAPPLPPHLIPTMGSPAAPSAPPLPPSSTPPLYSPHVVGHAPHPAEYAPRPVPRANSTHLMRGAPGAGVAGPSSIVGPSTAAVVAAPPPPVVSHLRALSLSPADEEDAVRQFENMAILRQMSLQQEEQRRRSASGAPSPSTAMMGAGVGASLAADTLPSAKPPVSHYGSVLVADVHQPALAAGQTHQQHYRHQQQTPQFGNAVLDAGSSSYSTSSTNSSNSTASAAISTSTTTSTISKSSTLAAPAPGVACSASTSRNASGRSQCPVTDDTLLTPQQAAAGMVAAAATSSCYQSISVNGSSQAPSAAALKDGSKPTDTSRPPASNAYLEHPPAGDHPRKPSSEGTTLRVRDLRTSSSGAGGGGAVCAPLPNLPLVVAPRDEARGRGCVGLQNLGNTCFMNSILQCLNAVPELVQHLLNPPDRSWSSEALVAPAYSALVRDMMGRSLGGCVNPSAFLRKVAKHDGRWGGGRQQDSQEFLISLLEVLQSECNRITSKPVYRELQGKGSEEAQAAEAFSYARSWHDSIVDDIFGGFVQSTLTCYACQRTSHTFEPFLGLAVPIPSLGTNGGSMGANSMSPERDRDRNDGGCGGQPVTVADCLRAFTEREELAGDDSYKCEACKRRQPHSKRLQIFRPPRVLVLTLKRFTQQPAIRPGASRTSSLFSSCRSAAKNNTPVRLDSDPLDLTPYCNPLGLCRLAVHGGGPVTPVYKLISVSHHSGSLEGGHYTAQALSCLDGQWYNFNDSSVRREPACPGGASSSAYVLFYRLTTLAPSSL